MQQKFGNNQNSLNAGTQFLGTKAVSTNIPGWCLHAKFLEECTLWCLLRMSDHSDISFAVETQLILFHLM